MSMTSTIGDASNAGRLYRVVCRASIEEQQQEEEQYNNSSSHRVDSFDAFNNNNKADRGLAAVIHSGGRTGRWITLLWTWC